MSRKAQVLAAMAALVSASAAGCTTADGEGDSGATAGAAAGISGGGGAGTAGAPVPPAAGAGSGAGAGASGGAGGQGPVTDAGSQLDAAVAPDANAPDAAPDTGPGSPGRVFSEDRADFFGSARCAAAADVLVCEDFESEAADAAPDSAVWSVAAGDPRIDMTRAARGAKSLHLHTEGNDSSVIEQTAIFPAANNTVYGRMFVWIDALPTAPQWAHWNLVAGNGTGDGSEIRIGGQWDGSRNRFGVGTDHGATGDWTNLDGDPEDAPMAVHEDEWMCIEWMYKGDSDELRFYWDGVEHPSLYASESEHGGNQSAAFTFPAFERLAIGWWLYHDNPTPDHYDVWIDEVILDDERIGCVL